jgi:hypothetical protein
MRAIQLVKAIDAASICMNFSVFAHWVLITCAERFQCSSLPAQAGASDLAKVFDLGRSVLDTPPSRGMTTGLMLVYRALR